MANIEQPLSPWDRQPAEPRRAFEAFEVYLFMDRPRSIARAAQQDATARGVLGGSSAEKDFARRWESWSSRYGWQGRVEAYDREIFHRRLAEREARRQELVLQRSDMECDEQSELTNVVRELRKKALTLLQLPNTDIEQTKYGGDGQILSEQKVKGLRPTEIAKLIDAYLKALTVAILGPVRVSRTERIPNEDDSDSGSFGGGGPMYLELDEWPDEGGSGPTS